MTPRGEERDEGGMSGAYPGGPRRKSRDPREDDQGRVRGGESIEAGRRRNELANRHSRSRRRKYVVVAVAVALGVGVGAYFGFSSITTAEDLVRADEEASRGDATDFDRQIQKVMDELWKMEREEAARGRRP